MTHRLGLIDSQVERIKATEPNVVAPIGSGALEERAQAGRKALGVCTSLQRSTVASQAATPECPLLHHLYCLSGD